MYVRGKRVQKGSTHGSSALQQRRTDGRRHTRETTETGACDYTARSWKGRRNEKGEKYWLSDATPNAIGGFYCQSRVWWRYDLSVDEQQRSSAHTTCASHNKLSINLLELLAMVVTAYVMVVVKEDRPSVAGEPVLMRGDSSSAVSWVNRCGGTRDPRAAFIYEVAWCAGSEHGVVL